MFSARFLSLSDPVYLAILALLLVEVNRNVSRKEGATTGTIAGNIEKLSIVVTFGQTVLQFVALGSVPLFFQFSS